jgi:hypothetical protein
VAFDGEINGTAWVFTSLFSCSGAAATGGMDRNSVLMTSSDRVSSVSPAGTFCCNKLRFAAVDLADRLLRYFAHSYATFLFL